jgi:hypothetical protein
MLWHSKPRMRSPSEKLQHLVADRTVDCELFEGLPDAAIVGAEARLGVQLPTDFCALLRFTNGFYLFGRSCAVYGLHVTVPPFRVGDFCETTLWYRQHAALSNTALIFGERSGGGLYQIESASPGTVTAYRIWYPGEDSLGQGSAFKNLATWLDAEVHFWQGVRAGSTT